MSFLEELEENKKKQEKSEKTPRELWESCFKYFKHFVSILTKNNSEFASEFNFVFLNVKKDCKVVGPFEVLRVQKDLTLKLEIKMHTLLSETIKINRNDKRSAELLQIKLSKDGILSSVKTDSKNNIFVELNQNITSIFRIILNEGRDFHIEYKNVGSSTNRSINLSMKNINEEYMDKIAKYILGQNPSLYTESISDQEITKIRNKIELNKQKKRFIEAEVKADQKRKQEQAQDKKDNTLKEKSRRYFSTQSHLIKSKLLDKIKSLKPK